MAVIRAFAAVRPAKDLADKVAALPYDVYDRKEALEVVKDDPLTFLNIDRPETQFGPDQDMYAPEVYEKAASMLRENIDSGVMIQDSVPALYIYELTMDGRAQTGIVACASIDDYLSGVIKRHENTRADKEQDRIRHVDVTGMQTGPIFLAYREIPKVTEIVSSCKAGEPDFDFVSPDGIRHRGWSICDRKTIDRITAAFADRPLYIADGHHRAASAVKAGLMRRERHPDYDGSEEFNYFLSVLFPDSELLIMDYNRVVHDLNGMSAEELMNRISEVCEVEEKADTYRPEKKGEMGIYVDGHHYKASFRRELHNDDPVKGLDVSLLQDLILVPLLDIGDPRTDKRIEFVGGIKGLKELEVRADKTGGISFAMYPTSIGELFAVADASLLMPPKSTWFEPKLRSGLYIHEIGQ